MNKILVVNVNWLGDVILSIPVFKALKRRYPQAIVSCFAVPRVRAILESCSYVDEIIEYDEDGIHKGIMGKYKLISRIRKKQFDIVFLLHRSWTRSFMMYLAGIPIRVGYDEKKRGRLLTHKVEALSGIVHRSDHYLHVIESYGIKVEDRSCDLVVSYAAQLYITDLLGKNKVFDNDYIIVVNTGGNWDLKRWAEDSFSVLIRRLSDEYNVKIIIPGAPKDEKQAKRITMLSNVKPIIFAGKTELKQLIALMKCADLVISADSGPLHIANCVGTKCIGIFGPTRPEITGPRGTGCFTVLQKDVGCNKSPCYFLDCPENVCMKSITVDDVMEVINDISDPRLRRVVNQ